MIQPLAPQPTDTPDYAKILRQGDLEDVLCELLADTFRATNQHEAYLHGNPHSLVVDDTGNGQIIATLWRGHDDGHGPVDEVAQVRLDYTVEQVTA